MIRCTTLGFPSCLRGISKQSERELNYVKIKRFSKVSVVCNSLVLIYLSHSIPESTTDCDKYLTCKDLMQVGNGVNELGV